MANTDKTYDIVIIGGGLIGASLLLSLQHSGLKIALIEANNHQLRTQPELDQRSLVLSLGSKLYFEDLGIWENIASFVTEIKKIKVSEQGKFAKVVLDQHSLQVPALGYVINIQLLNQAIWDSLGNNKNIDVLCPCRLEDLQQNNAGALLQVEHHGAKYNIATKIVIAADGARSFVRSLLNLPVAQHDYNQVALIANVQHEVANDNIAFERFSENGPFAILPRENKYISGIVWPLDPNNTDDIKNMPDDVLLKNLQQVFGYKLGRFCKIGARQFFPLWKITAKQLYKDRVILLGNAANSIHPIGGQGFNLGLRDVKSFSKLLLKNKQSLANNLDINQLFADYVNTREDDHEDLANGTHNLLNLFASRNLAVATFRNISMVVMNHSLILRSIIADKSMGLV